ncbi:hypothetical protein F5X68DRAFT_54823 [Plectosphaerella plurivora]|uniref:Uncharacterized protein n=1 Tax=Plectosphaerella plurivora TaxID=936078 RepID=A0A9P8V1Y7_9PEZI|nr:hypothetical protein F5X68DRAFT_54823 [Plectosphaerella plurivora]
MKFSAVSTLALPILGAVAEVPQYQAQFQNVMGNIGAQVPGWIPFPSRHDETEAARTKADQSISVLNIFNWKDTLYEPVLNKFKDSPADGPRLSSESPENWWLLVTGGNKSCLGRCAQVEQAFNETAAKFATLPKAPHMAYVDCDKQPILCNVLSTGPATLWSIDMEWPGNNVTIWTRRMNVTTTTTETFEKLYKEDRAENFRISANNWHPFNSWLAQNHLAIPIASILWAFSVIPNWATMLIISFFSRRAMNRRMADGPPEPGAAPAGAAPRAAPRPAGRR